MKKNLSTRNWSMIFIFILLSNIGCNEDEILGPIKPEPKPEPNPVVTVNVYALPESIAYAGTTTVYWNTSNVASATINNISIPTNGSKLFEGIVKDTTFIFNFVGVDKTIKTDTVTIKVEEPIIIAPTRIDTICGGYYMLIKVTLFSENEISYVNLDEDDLTRKRYYYKNGTYEIFKKNGELVGNGDWELIEKDSIRVSDSYTKIVSLTDTSWISCGYRTYSNGKIVKSIGEYKRYKL